MGSLHLTLADLDARANLDWLPPLGPHADMHERFAVTLAGRSLSNQRRRTAFFPPLATTTLCITAPLGRTRAAPGHACSLPPRVPPGVPRWAGMRRRYSQCEPNVTEHGRKWQEMAGNDKKVVAAWTPLTAPRTLFRSPAYPREQPATSRDQTCPSCLLPWPRHSTHAARCATLYTAHSACRCPQEPRKRASIPRPTKTHRASSHLAVRPTTALQSTATDSPPTRDPARPRDWLARRPIPGRLPEGSWRFAHCLDSARFLLRVQADVAASWHHQSHAGTSCQTVVASKCCGNPGVLRGDTPAPASC